MPRIDPSELFGQRFLIRDTWFEILEFKKCEQFAVDNDLDLVPKHGWVREMGELEELKELKELEELEELEELGWRIYSVDSTHLETLSYL